MQLGVAVGRTTAMHAALLPLLQSAATAVLVTGAALALPDAQAARLALPVAQLVLAGAAAHLMDEPLIALTGIAPRPLWRRRTHAAITGLAVLAPAWLAIVFLLRWRLPEAPMTVMALETVSLTFCALAVAGLAAFRMPAPGSRVHLGLLGAGLAAAQILGLAGVDIFAASDPSKPGHAAWWAVLGTASLAASAAPALRRRSRLAARRSRHEPAP